MNTTPAPSTPEIVAALERHFPGWAIMGKHLDEQTGFRQFSLACEGVGFILYVPKVGGYRWDLREPVSATIISQTRDLWDWGKSPLSYTAQRVKESLEFRVNELNARIGQIKGAAAGLAL